MQRLPTRHLAFRGYTFHVVLFCHVVQENRQPGSKETAAQAEPDDMRVLRVPVPADGLCGWRAVVAAQNPQVRRDLSGLEEDSLAERVLPDAQR